MSNAGTGSRWHRVLATAIVVVGWMVLLMPTQAWAQFYVNQPEVEKGEIELEEHGAIFSGPGADEPLRQRETEAHAGTRKNG